MEVTAPYALPFPFWPQNDDSDNQIDGSGDALVIARIDACTAENGAKHHTDKFEAMSATRRNGHPPQLVVRRGQPFHVKFITNRPFQTQHDSLSLVLSVDPMGGEWVGHGHGTVVYMMLRTEAEQLAEASEGEQESDWSARLQAIETREDGWTELLVEIRTSTNASVSRWNLTVYAKSKGSTESTTSCRLDQPLYLLYNPWCEEDPVYLSDEAKRKEYVLEDMTMVWRGTERQFYSNSWKLGQYEENVLNCTLWLLGEVAHLSATYRGNPIKVCRALSGVVNSNDDYGVLVGKWDNKFDDGTAPAAWTGSVKILQEYFATKRSVRYGQCWVFSGVLGTLCRALGIPCRIVTNFSSAHDTEASLTVDVYLDEEGNVMKEFSRDSIWNYHVWNEVWLSRRDLDSSAYDGWQVIDGTPQEFSDGTFKLGPAPVEAIKNGLVNMLYDCDFVFAEVNADRVFWRYRGPGKSLKLIQKDTTVVGQFISTKAVGVDEREDITGNYKSEEQSAEAKLTMFRALKLGESCLTKHYLKQVKVDERASIKHRGRDVEFELELNDQALVGEPFAIELRIRNTSNDHEHSVGGWIHLNHIMYTGKNLKTITSRPFSVTVGASGEETVSVKITFDDYYGPGMDEAIFKVTSFASIQGADYEYFSQEDYSLRKPGVKLQIDEKPTLGAPLQVTASFENPLPIPLTDGAFLIECSGLTQTLPIPVAKINARAKCVVAFDILPSFAGPVQLSAKFNSIELSDLEGSLTFEV